MTVAPPESERELLGRTRDIAGYTLQDLALRLQVTVPTDTRRAKGWAGTLIEMALGATAASKPEPDFQLIGVEMKTIPIGAQGHPRESTYVCTVPLTNNDGATWTSSNVHRKLKRVLWVPIEGSSEIPLGERCIGSALLWSPSAEEEAGLQADWEELMDMVCLGELSRITAHHGTWLQIRPKAANSRAKRRSIGESGEPAQTLPRGFYLRATFTAALLRRHYLMPECYS